MATPRPRLQVIRLTDAAAERIKYVMANAAQTVVGVRVGVKNGGCAGMAYTMEYAERVEKADEVVEDKGVRVLIDPRAVLFLLGTEMDYKTDKLSAQFVFNNPNQTSACGCGESVELKPSAEPLARPRASSWLPTTSANCSRVWSGRGLPHVRWCRHLFRRHDVLAGCRRRHLFEGGPARCARLRARELEPFIYSIRAGRRAVMSYRRMPDRLYDDPDESRPGRVPRWRPPAAAEQA